GTYGSRRFYGTICTWEKCRRPDMYRAHQVRAEVTGQNISILFLEPQEDLTPQKVFRKLSIPQSQFKYYDQEFGGYSEGFEAMFLADPIEKEVHKENGLTVVREQIPVLEIRFVKFKNDP